MSSSGRIPPPPGMVECQVHRWDRIAAALKRLPGHEEETKPPQRPLVTISGTTGSGRAELGRQLAYRLNYDVYGQELVQKVAQDLGLDQPVVEGLDETAKSEIHLILSTWMRGREIESNDYFRSLARVMVGIARSGGAIILGRGGNLFLKQFPEMLGLSVRLDSPLEQRVTRVMAERACSTEEARRFIERCDKDRRDFIRRYFQSDVADPLGYDMTINTDRLGIAQCVDVIVGALAARGYKI